MPRKTDHAGAPSGTETELKLALLTDDLADLADRLSRAPVLARRKPVQHGLHSIYFDTPQQHLRRAQAALRIRRVDSVATSCWVQTLKTGPRGSSALSRRGEWEAPVSGPALESAALDARAWSHIDGNGKLFNTLVPCFITDFTRTIWLVRRRDGSVVEVALDIGSVVSGERRAPICELELELKSGPVSVLFEIAEMIAGTVPLLPLAMSKAQWGYALATDAIDAPTTAAPPRLTPGMATQDAARLVLRETFGQFTANLNALCRSDGVEVVHQARVAWRRLRSALRLFKPILLAIEQPDWTTLDPLLALLGELRDVDVARVETLPPLREAYVAHSASRARAWDAMSRALDRCAAGHRTAVRHALRDPAIGVCLLQATRWLESTAAAQDGNEIDGAPLKRWATHRAKRWHKQLAHAARTADTPQELHKLRLMAKRTRYGIEALQGVLPRRMVRTWHADATDLQKRIGTDRDHEQAVGLLVRIEACADLVAYLRGVVAGRSTR